jgi:hypothetical protein
MTAESQDQAPRRSAAGRQRRSARAQAAERQRRQSLIKGISIGVAVLVVLVIAGVVLYQRQQAEASIPAGTQSYSYSGAQHTADLVEYTEHPPVGGLHNAVWQNCGFYAAPIRNETAVHSLEHGAIWITYAPDLPQDQIATLQDLAAQQSYILVSPMDDLPSPVVASAWGRQLQLDSADDERLDQFIRRFRLSPEAPEPGAACTGGTSETV